MRSIDKRQLIMALAALLVVVAAALGLSFTQRPEAGTGKALPEVAAAKVEQLQDACASATTYSRLKQIAFEEAVRIRNADPANLDTLATHSVVRMENPVVKSSDENLGVTVCSGRFILELPPGAERAFGGERRLSAEVEYAAQAAADGSGLVYQIEGAEPIIYKLAAFDLKGQRFQQPPPVGTEFAGASPPPVPAPLGPPAPTLEPQSTPVPQPQVALEPGEAKRAERGSSRPSFNCRYARSRGEIMVCESDRLAASDRRMSSAFYSALSNADRSARRKLRRTRDKFLAYRDRCRTEACVAQAYEGRMREIRDIMAEEN